MKLLNATISLSILSVALGFQARSPLQASPKATTSSTLSVLPPVEHLNDVHSVLTDSTAFSFLADAAAAVVAPDGDVAEAIQDKQGWWQSYINLFKIALNGIHDAIDGPLNAAGITQTWGISIALFTASFRSLLLPLSLQQSKQAEYMKALKPYQNEIKKKFKDNKDAQNRAMSKLFEDADQNPLAGCGISLAQLPVLLGLYRGIRNLAIDGNLDEPFLWIPSLQGPVTAETDYRGLDWLTQNWVDGVPPLGWETTLAFCIMPVLLVLGQSLSMNVLQPPLDEDAPKAEREQMEQTQKYLKFLPLMIGFFSLQVPAGLTIYWFTTNLFTVGSTLAARTYYSMNPPEIELPEYWESIDNLDEMSSEEKRKAAKAGLQVGPTYESMLEESRFHTLVERQALRTSLPASSEIPPQMAGWVAAGGGASAPSHTMEESVTEQKDNSTVVATAAA
mmetsp:Transcript_565/g.961  ORF Transcript_565/g.961 Transcript_565/m.961 type:complete len:449 (+) Transcript_565:201-1547(+)|eukprot:CAMPEP_0113617834 /NCGR_PEP_ID=MMETSP0017_2-20120614/9002_1 /TAXON_ID=2856 /ORGANISM="Cylindrotheca closterium" /LENGTH=448 /DNA_ID=CAMNT_0000527277 /DNA_START=224 /DNA_END=1570 /DNA_ORIENTATION=+ /assembly_acc=CAM_ASM_000147